MTKADTSSSEATDTASAARLEAVSQAMKTAERAVVAALAQQVKTIEASHHKAALAAQAIAAARAASK